MTKATDPRVFVVHAPADVWFVQGFLLDALRRSRNEVLVSSNLELGTSIVEQIERGVLCPVTVVLVSPAFLASPWAQFADRLATHRSVETSNDGNIALVPAILADCELPLRLRSLVSLDFRNQQREHWDAEVAKLRKTVEALAPASPRSVLMPDNAGKIPARSSARGRSRRWRKATRVPRPSPPAPLKCPYRGLESFTLHDASHFFGRTREVANLLDWLRAGRRELYVIGPSGCGKSSLIAAGLLPSLGRNNELGECSFIVRQMRPGCDPTTALASALNTTAVGQDDTAMRWLCAAVDRLMPNRVSHDRLLIVVDQLEELFTIAEANSREIFLSAIRTLRVDSRVVLVFTLRADFYALLMESPLWADVDGQLARLDVGPLRGEKLRTAIEAPARALGVYFEPVLVERLLHHAADEPGALPLLQDTLHVLWHRRVHRLLRLAEYEAMGDGENTGLAVTMARRADGALSALTRRRREIAQRVILRLVQFGDGTADTRRRQPRATLATAGDAPEEIDAVIHHLAERRLITVSAGDEMISPATVDLAHEVLLSAWPAFGAWIRIRKEDEQRRRALETKAAEWVKHGRGRWRLLDTDALREVRDWLSDDKARDLGVSEEIQSYLTRSETEIVVQRADAECRRRRWRWAVIAAFVMISMLAGVAWQQSQKAQKNLASNYVSHAHVLLTSSHPERAAPYLLAAREAGLEDVSLRTLFRWAVRYLPIQQIIHHSSVNLVEWSPVGTLFATASSDNTVQVWDPLNGYAMTPPLTHLDRIAALAWSPDGKRIVTASADKVVRVWDAIRGVLIFPLIAHSSEVTVIAWNPDGRRLASGSEDHTVRVWDALSGVVISPPLAHESGIRTLEWSPDGARLATVSASGTIRQWEVASGQVMVSPLPHRKDVHTLAWSPTGTLMATTIDDRSVEVWNAVSGQSVIPPLLHPSGVSAVAWSPDGKRLATGCDAVRVWDVTTGQEVTTVFAHQVSEISWSPDGERIATGSHDDTAQVWDANTGQPLSPVLAHQDWVTAVAWSPDGKKLVTTSSDATTRVWDVDSDQAGPLQLSHSSLVKLVAWSPDGRQVATASHDGTARVWDSVVGKAITPPLLHRDAVQAVAWSPDGRRVATAGNDHTAQLWDAVTGRALTPPLVHNLWVLAVAWSPDGRRVATASADNTARVWDAATGHPVTPPLEHLGWVSSVAWSSDGKRVATASFDGTARVWDARSGHAVTPPLEHEHMVNLVAWSPDATRLVTASHDGTARIWDARSGFAVTPPLAHANSVGAAVWSPDGKQVATASSDGTARVWNAETGQAVTPPLTHEKLVMGIAWSPDGTRVATASGDKTAQVWDARTGQAVTPPLVHELAVWSVAWSPDGLHLATASADKTARIWDVSWDAGTLDDWRSALERSDYSVNGDGILVARERPRFIYPSRGMRSVVVKDVVILVPRIPSFDTIDLNPH